MPDTAPLLSAAHIRAECLRFLVAQGYERKRESLRIVHLDFDFEDVLEGPHGHHGLVLVVEVRDLTPDALDALRRRLGRLSLALSRTGSRRPVTLVLVTPSATPSDIDALRPLGRVVVVERREQAVDGVADALRAFVPLDPVALARPEAADAALARHLGAARDETMQETARRLRVAARRGARHVEETFVKMVEDVIANADSPSS